VEYQIRRGLAQVSKHGFECGAIAVNIREDRDAHLRPLFVSLFVVIIPRASLQRNKQPSERGDKVCSSENFVPWKSLFNRVASEGYRRR
jgi:hypothetical protein